MMFGFLKKKLLVEKEEYEFYYAYLENIARTREIKAIQFEIFMEFYRNLDTIQINDKDYKCSKVTYNGKGKWVCCKGDMNTNEALYKLADAFYSDNLPEGINRGNSST